MKRIKHYLLSATLGFSGFLGLGIAPAAQASSSGTILDSANADTYDSIARANQFYGLYYGTSYYDYSIYLYADIAFRYSESAYYEAPSNSDTATYAYYAYLFAYYQSLYAYYDYLWGGYDYEVGLYGSLSQLYRGTAINYAEQQGGGNQLP